MSATMHTISITFTVPDKEQLPYPWDDHLIASYVRIILAIELRRIAKLHPTIFAVPPEIV